MASVSVTHRLLVPSQPRPEKRAQPAPSGSHAAPTVVTPAWHVVLSTQTRPSVQGTPDAQDAPSPAATTHVCAGVVQESPPPHE